MTVVKDKPLAFDDCFVQGAEDGVRVKQSPKGSDFHLNLEHRCYHDVKADEHWLQDLA